MATKTFIGFNKKTAAALTKGIARPIEKNKTFFTLLNILIDQSTQDTFRKQGERDGHRKWDAFSPDTLQNAKGKFRRRPGTDGSTTRRYDANSKLMQASGGFRRSFGNVSIRNGQLIYGIGGLNMRNLGKKIMSNPERQVLFVNRADRKKWGLLFANFVDKGIKF